MGIYFFWGGTCPCCFKPLFNEQVKYFDGCFNVIGPGCKIHVGPLADSQFFEGPRIRVRDVPDVAGQFVIRDARFYPTDCCGANLIPIFKKDANRGVTLVRYSVNYGNPGSDLPRSWPPMFALLRFRGRMLSDPFQKIGELDLGDDPTFMFLGPPPSGGWRAPVRDLIRREAVHRLRTEHG